MTSTSRIERIADRLKAVGGHLFNGTSLMALNGMLYAVRNSLVGELFLAFEHSYGTNFAVLACALVFLVCLWGFMLALYLVIAGIVAIAQGIKSLRRTPDVTPPDSRRAANIATIAE